MSLERIPYSIRNKLNREFQIPHLTLDRGKLLHTARNGLIGATLGTVVSLVPYKVANSIDYSNTPSIETGNSAPQAEDELNRCHFERYFHNSYESEEKFTRFLNSNIKMGEIDLVYFKGSTYVAHDLEEIQSKSSDTIFLNDRKVEKFSDRMITKDKSIHMDLKRSMTDPQAKKDLIPRLQELSKKTKVVLSSQEWDLLKDLQDQTKDLDITFHYTVPNSEKWQNFKTFYNDNNLVQDKRTGLSISFSAVNRQNNIDYDMWQFIRKNKTKTMFWGIKTKDQIVELARSTGEYYDPNYKIVFVSGDKLFGVAADEREILEAVGTS